MDTYVRIRLLCRPSSLINYAVLGYVLGRGEAKLGLVMQFVLNGGEHPALHRAWAQARLGRAGVAWATVCGETVAAAARPGDHPGQVPPPAAPVAPAHIQSPGDAGACSTLNRDIMIRSFALLAAFALFTRQGAQFGTLTLAANAVLMNFFLRRRLFPRRFRHRRRAACRACHRRRASGRAFTAAVRLTAVWGFALAGAATPGAAWPSAAIWSADVTTAAGRPRGGAASTCPGRPSPR